MDWQPPLVPAPRPHGQHERDGFRRGKGVLHLRRGTHLVSPAAGTMVIGRAGRFQRKHPLAKADRAMANPLLAAQEWAGASAPPAACRGGQGLCHTWVARAGHRAGRRHRGSVANLRGHRVHAGNDFLGRGVVALPERGAQGRAGIQPPGHLRLGQHQKSQPGLGMATGQ